MAECTAQMHQKGAQPLTTGTRQAAPLAKGSGKWQQPKSVRRTGDIESWGGEQCFRGPCSERKGNKFNMDPLGWEHRRIGLEGPKRTHAKLRGASRTLVSGGLYTLVIGHGEIKSVWSRKLPLRCLPGYQEEEVVPSTSLASCLSTVSHAWSYPLCDTTRGLPQRLSRSQGHTLDF